MEQFSGLKENWNLQSKALALILFFQGYQLIFFFKIGAQYSCLCTTSFVFFSVSHRNVSFDCTVVCLRWFFRNFHAPEFKMLPRLSSKSGSSYIRVFTAAESNFYKDKCSPSCPTYYRFTFTIKKFVYIKQWQWQQQHFALILQTNLQPSNNIAAKHAIHCDWKWLKSYQSGCINKGILVKFCIRILIQSINSSINVVCKLRHNYGEIDLRHLMNNIT